MTGERKSLYRKVREFVGGDTEFDLSKSQEAQQAKKPELLHVAGRQVISREAADARLTERLRQEKHPSVYWGGVRIPDKTHFLYAGQTRSGKGVLMKQLMADVFSHFGTGTNQRALIYDPSNELISFLYGLVGERIPIHILNPLDARCTPWLIAADVDDKDVALDVGHIIFPKGEGKSSSKDDFFTEGPATLFANLVDSFILANEERCDKKEEPLDWTLRHICLALRDEEDAKALLRQRPETKRALKFLESNNPDLDRTVINKFEPLESVAARWDFSAKTSVSLREFVQSKDSAIIVLGGSTSKVVSSLNRVIFEHLARLMLDPSIPSETDSRTWIFLDEFADLGRMETMSKLLSMGLKKGVRLVAAYQNIAAIEKVYGKHDPEVIRSEIATVALLRQQRRAAAESSEFIGEREVQRRRNTYGTDQRIVGGIGAGKSEQEEYVPEKQPVVRQSDIEELPESGEGHGITGYFLTHFVYDVFKHHFQWKELAQLANLRSAEPDFAPHESRQAKHLRAWTDDERKAFGIAPAPSDVVPREGGKTIPSTKEKSEKFDIDRILDSMRERGRKNYTP